MYNFCCFFSIAVIYKQRVQRTGIHTHVKADKAHNHTHRHMNTTRHNNNLGMLYVRCARVLGEIRFHHIIIIKILYNILYYTRRSL